MADKREVKCPRCGSDDIQEVSRTLTSIRVVGSDEWLHTSGEKRLAPEYAADASEVHWDCSETAWYECNHSAYAGAKVLLCGYENPKFEAFVTDQPEYAAAVESEKGVWDAKLAGFTDYTFRCQSCRKLCRATAQAIKSQRENTDCAGLTDAEVAASFEYCLECCDGVIRHGEKVEDEPTPEQERIEHVADQHDAAEPLDDEEPSQRNAEAWSGGFAENH